MLALCIYFGYEWIWMMSLIQNSCNSPRVKNTPRKFLLVESEILGFGIRNPALRIRNPANDWNLCWIFTLTVGSNCLPSSRCLSSVFWSLGAANVLRPEGSISTYPYHIRYPTPFPRLFLVLNFSLREFLSLISRVNPERKSYDTWYLSILTQVESKLIDIGLVLGFYTLRLRCAP